MAETSPQRGTLVGRQKHGLQRPYFKAERCGFDLRNSPLVSIYVLTEHSRILSEFFLFCKKLWIDD